VFLTAESLTEPDRWTAALAFAGEGAALSGSAALRASDVRRVVERPQILVLVPIANASTSHGWVRVRRTERAIPVLNWLGPRRVEIARAAADLALILRRTDDVRSLVARVVQDGHCTVAELGQELETGPRRGSANLRAALEEVGWGAESAPEARAARILRAAGIVDFEMNATLVLGAGVQRRVDFYWRDLRAVLEIDSVEFHFTREDWNSTLDRHMQLTTAGYSVIHRPPSALRDERRFVVDVRAWLAARRLELTR